MRGRSLLLLAVLLAACEHARLPVDAGVGARPELPSPQPSLVPTVKIAKATGWPDGRTPVAASGLAVHAFATGLQHPRWLYVLPNGDVLVAETNAPAKPPHRRTIKEWFMDHFQKVAGAAVPSPDRITLLRDADGDGVAETRTPFLEHLHSPFGMALAGDAFYVGNTDAVVRVPYRDGDTSITAAPETIVALPAGAHNYHWTRNVVANGDGSRLYVSVGSDSNIGERGMAAEERRAAILEVDPRAKSARLFASGLRNPVGMAWEPSSGALWAVVNERDEMGSDLVPDLFTSIRDGSFYGWPYSYFGRHVDARVQPQRPELVATAVTPDYAIGPHAGSLGLAFYTASLLPPHYAGGAFIGQHGSWNRRPRSGYKVIFVPFANGRPRGEAEDVLTGFIDERDRAMGRPVGMAVDRAGALLVADDVGNAIWRVTPAR
ncbi:MAG TPA: sorbosone dehydrogenase family protein [Thermoanaerobaculia bacterium]|jgi:glucose/arabinose dehydrogenase